MRKKGILNLRHLVNACLIFLFTSALVYGASLQEEFSKLCVHSQDAETLSIEKLQGLLDECDLLQKKIEASTDPQKKVLLFRLGKCRNFFAYIIELKQGGNSSNTQ